MPALRAVATLALALTWPCISAASPEADLPLATPTDEWTRLYGDIAVDDLPGSVPTHAQMHPAVPSSAARGRAEGDAAPAGTGVDALLANALSHLGVRYRRGGDRPETGFDCSGLVRWVFDRTLSLALPRRAEDIARTGTPVEAQDLRPGDLVFFNTLRRKFSHIGIYLGEGRFVHAPSAGGRVRVEALDQTYWRKRWNGARRVVLAEPPAP